MQVDRLRNLRFASFICVAALSSGCQAKAPTVASDPNFVGTGATHCAESKAQVDATWTDALAAAQAAYETHAQHIVKKDLVTVINYDTLLRESNRLRVYDVTKDWAPTRSAWVSHAAASGTECATQFSNVPQSYISSRGAFVTDTTIWNGSDYGKPALRINGLEAGVNHKARSRSIIFHKALDRAQKALDLSLGCFMTRPAVNAVLLPEIAGGSLLYVYSSMP